jgi:hypothetical protein
LGWVAMSERELKRAEVLRPRLRRGEGTGLTG